LKDVPASIRNNVAMQASQMPQAGQWEYQNIIQDGETRTVERNKITGETREVTGKTINPNMGMNVDIGGNHDLSYLAPKYPRQAWAANNNPTGITW
jgi:hypothetical protein